MSNARRKTMEHVEHLGYELRMLLGTHEMISIAERNNWGNSVNYFKDSAYVHIRNLYAFFTDPKAKFDVSIKDFGHECMESDIYTKALEKALNKRVAHISPGRPNNEIHEPITSTQLNEMVPILVKDLADMWRVWISLTDNLELRQDIQHQFNEAHKAAEDDRMRGYFAPAQSASYSSIP